jgi:AcrR family transcriptional regulator
LNLTQRIQEKAHELYRKFGLRSVTMDEIAASLGISKKTIYTFFADKDALVDAVILSELELNQLQCDKDKAKATNAIHEVFLALEMMEKTFADMNPSLINDLKKYHPKSYEKFETFKNKYLYNIIKTNIERGIAEALYRPDIHVELMTIHRLESMMMVFNLDLLFTKNFKLAEIHEQLVCHFLYGIASLKGNKLITKYSEQSKKKLTGNEKN